jgi:hypothetical protein
VTRFRLVRLLRTLSSEIYLIWQGDSRVGQIDLHYTDSSVQADVFLEAPLEEDDRHHLIARIDDEIVASYLPSFQRDQFIVTVFVGREIDSFNYSSESEEISEN